MRFTLASLLLGLLSITSTTALSTSSTLARLSARLAAAEQTLLQLKSGYAAPTAQYLWDQVWTDTNGGNAAVKVEAWNTNIALYGNSARGSSVLSRSASISQAATFVRVPVSLPASAFTVGVWVSWSGTSQPDQSEGTVLSTAGDSLKIAISSAGVVSATVSGATVSAGSVAVGAWNHFIVTYGSGKFFFYKNGQSVGSAVAAFPGASSINLLNNAARTAGFVGSLDTFHVFSSELDSTDAGFLYDDTNKAGSGFSTIIEDGPARWYGHLATSSVTFQNVVQGQQTGDITVKGIFLDAELRDSNSLWFVLFGCTAPSVTDVAIDYLGTKATVSWDANTMIMVVNPLLNSPIAQGAEWTFHIPGSALALNNPSVASGRLATANDPRWIVSVAGLDLDQTPLPEGSPTTTTKRRKQGLRWQGITDTPITYNDKPALLL